MTLLKKKAKFNTKSRQASAFTQYHNDFSKKN